ncbi:MULTISPECIES: tRNA dihydrouridine synthase DusB [unclassified Methylophaga]|jgi:tRNA-dihydrouridine synthase B|uniref:tRNA dihydrouridine synthase DusB n=2 Tax=Methylophaga TaxID=40222 RepID=UPI000C945D65|nr:MULTISPECIES: tRNA dihydrouridine synthase DusB [unclassified Methylophaga]MAK66744.1 tRNA dihydrouridine synthase DusB [Methylophaga sp.]MAY17688.1 tRNA dihydrouridine synthase DusB [Methylophaga sp.]HAO24997.1 tRNA dihydrouridine synthase DusB [Methylophaga sp.]|tara:strand:+ start:74607 stop:75608 length:1002 start_codon:yes stop_codon:yes gene_type:complete
MADKAFSIGPYTLPNNLFLAPMAGVTDRPFRQLCRKLGAGMAVSEMITANKALWASKKSLLRANHEGEPEPRSVQIAGADPQMMAEAARHNVAEGAHIIDINMGCPAKKVCNVMAGSALLQHEKLVGDILEAVVQAVDVPVTLKIRTGWDRDNRNGIRIARIAEDAGIQALAVHGRTRADAYKGDAEYDTIAEIKSRIGIPVIANGDIETPQKALMVLQKTGADGLMIGRAAQGNPWIFQQILHFLQTGDNLPEPSVTEVQQILISHLNTLYDFYGEYSGVRMARKHIAWYSKGLRNGNAFRQQMNTLEKAEQQLAFTDAFFAQLADKDSLAA